MNWQRHALPILAGGILASSLATNVLLAALLLRQPVAMATPAATGWQMLRPEFVKLPAEPSNDAEALYELLHRLEISASNLSDIRLSVNILESDVDIVRKRLTATR